MSGFGTSWLSDSIPTDFVWSFKEADLLSGSESPPTIDLNLRAKIHELSTIKNLCEKYPQQSPSELTSTITDFTQKIAGLKEIKEFSADVPLLVGAAVIGCSFIFTALRIDLVVKLTLLTGGALSGSLLAISLCLTAGAVVGIAAKYFAKKSLAKEEASIDALEPKITQLLINNKLFLNQLIDLSKTPEKPADKLTMHFIQQLNSNREI